MINPTANKKFFDKLPDHERVRYADILLRCYQLHLGVRCEVLGGREFQLTIGYGLASAKWWLDMYELPTA